MRKCLGKERAPGQEPEKYQAVEKKDGNGVVVDRIALAEITEELFVNKVKPEEAFGLAGRRIGDGGEDMPRSRDEKKDDCAGDEMHLKEVAQVARQQQKDEDDGAGEDDADESLGEDVESDYRGDAPAGKKRGLFRLPAVEEQIEGDADPEADGDVGNQDAREEIRSARGQENHGGPEAGLWRQEAAAEEVEEKGKGEDADVEREAGAPGVDSEEFDSDGGTPVSSREAGLFRDSGCCFREGWPSRGGREFRGRRRRGRRRRRPGEVG